MLLCFAVSPLSKVVHTESPENGEKEAKRSRREEPEEDCRPDQERIKTQEEPVEVSLHGTVEAQLPAHTSHDVEMNTGNNPPHEGSLTHCF